MHPQIVEDARSLLARCFPANKILEAAPWPFIRGCIRSDGSVFINRTDIHRPEPYEYLSYEFSNASEAIARFFESACEGLGSRPRSSVDAQDRWRVRMNRRESVARLLVHVGVKS
jgi:hypothetical protein